MDTIKVAFLSSEVFPYSKTGGLADISGALPRFLQKSGRVDVKVFSPLYRQVKNQNRDLKPIAQNLKVSLSGASINFSLFEADRTGFPTIFISNDDYFDRDFLYGTEEGDYQDNGLRFAFFCRASFEAMKHLSFQPDIVHAHDWQAALTAAYLKFHFQNDDFFRSTRSVFTIHNLAYQGLFDKGILGQADLPPWLYNMNDLEYYGRVSFIKAGILYSSAVTTVSRKYSLEIQTPEFGFGLDGLIRTRAESVFGILNGIDYEFWDPASDKSLPANYTPEDLTGKKACKKVLNETFGLSPDPAIPIAGMVTRLAGQKGLDLVCQAIDRIFASGIKLVILGTGEKSIQDYLEKVARKYPYQLGLKIAFDDALARLIYAGSDMFLIPSSYEPCGLTQMYSLKYGTIPVVRATGGLDDTISEFDPLSGQGNGFKFVPYKPEALVQTLEKAVKNYQRPEIWSKLVTNAMACDFSWEKSAEQYISLYSDLVKNR